MTKFAAYTKEISPTIRKVDELKEELKEFKKADVEYLKLMEVVKEAQNAAKDYLKNHAVAGDLTEQISELGKDLKEAFEAAAKDTEFEPKDVAVYLKARNKIDGVAKVLDKSAMFEKLGELL